MKWVDFEKKNPNQLMNTLRNWKWNKKSIVDLLDCYEIETEDILNQMTYLEICTKYKSELMDCVEEEYSSC